MGGRVLVVDRNLDRRAALTASLAPTMGRIVGSGCPEALYRQVAAERPDLVVLGLDGSGEEGLDALRRLHARPGHPPPTMALVPADAPGLRLAALRAGAETVEDRDAQPRLLLARLRSLLRQREAAIPASLPEEMALALEGFAEGQSAFLPLGGPAPADPPRLGLLALGPLEPGAPLDALPLRLDAEAVWLAPGGARPRGTSRLDLVAIDAGRFRGDLAEGAHVLSTLAELRARIRMGSAATLLLLPADAVQTAALALDIGACDVIVGPACAEEVALRARALVARRRRSEAMRDHVRLGLRAALVDPLTGLHNRRYAEAALRRIADRARSHGQGYALLMIDIDHFKAINDSRGHAIGDRVLVEVGRRLKAALRPGDLLARVGGEEFLVALPGASDDTARALAERLRRAVDHQPFAAEAQAVAAHGSLQSWIAGWEGDAAPQRDDGAVPVRVTVSIGVAAADPDPAERGSGPAEVLRRADVALYEAKVSGRNAVVSAAA